MLCLAGYVWGEHCIKRWLRQMLKWKQLPVSRLLLASNAPFEYPMFVHHYDEDRNCVADHPSVHWFRDETTCLTDTSVESCVEFCTQKRNEPCGLPCVLELVAACVELDPESLATQLRQNISNVFDFSHRWDRMSCIDETERISCLPCVLGAGGGVCRTGPWISGKATETEYC
jgi:hypothetical protein